MSQSASPPVELSVHPPTEEVNEHIKRYFEGEGRE